MKTLLLFCSYLFIANVSIAQNDTDTVKPIVNNVPSDEISIELGMFSRGLIGLGYSHNFTIDPKTFFSLHGSMGVGFGFESINQYFTFAPSVSFGDGRVYGAFGLEAKYCQISLPYSLSNNDKTRFGPAGGGFLSLKFYAPKWNFKVRANAFWLYDQNEDLRPFVGAGISFGRRVF